MHKRIACWLGLCLSLVPSTVLAAQYDGSVPLLCAVIEVLECEAGGECHRGDAESVNLPPFAKIDVPQQVLSTTETAAEQRTTPIRHVEHLDGQLTLQGGEGRRAWSLIIAEGTGKLTATITDIRWSSWFSVPASPSRKSTVMPCRKVDRDLLGERA